MGIIIAEAAMSVFVTAPVAMWVVLITLAPISLQRLPIRNMLLS
jgi:uncharacterized protein (DUF983 family)